jgi:endonuclease YncB( thermonuclease family)
MTALLPYTFYSYINRTKDGDTVEVFVDQGFGTARPKQSFRILGINAREEGQPGGPEAAAHLAELLPVNTRVIVNSVKPDKYGDRYDGKITLPDGRDLSSVLIAEQWAAPWNGQGTKPVPPWPRTITD